MQVDSVLAKASGDTKYVASMGMSALPDKADFKLIPTDSASKVKLEKMTPKAGGIGITEYDYTEIETAKLGGGIWTSVDLDETADFCKYRVSVTGADGATTKEYELTVRVDSDNTNLEYIKVGQHSH